MQGDVAPGVDAAGGVARADRDIGRTERVVEGADHFRRHREVAVHPHDGVAPAAVDALLDGAPQAAHPDPS